MSLYKVMEISQNISPCLQYWNILQYIVYDSCVICIISPNYWPYTDVKIICITLICPQTIPQTIAVSDRRGLTVSAKQSIFAWSLLLWKMWQGTDIVCSSKCKQPWISTLVVALMFFSSNELQVTKQKLNSNKWFITASHQHQETRDTKSKVKQWKAVRRR